MLSIKPNTRNWKSPQRLRPIIETRRGGLLKIDREIEALLIAHAKRFISSMKLSKKEGVFPELIKCLEEWPRHILQFNKLQIEFPIRTNLSSRQGREILLHVLKEEAVKEKQYKKEASTTIQRVARGYKGRKEAKTVEEEAKTKKEKNARVCHIWENHELPGEFYDYLFIRDLGNFAGTSKSVQSLVKSSLDKLKTEGEKLKQMPETTFKECLLKYEEYKKWSFLKIAISALKSARKELIRMHPHLRAEAYERLFDICIKEYRRLKESGYSDGAGAVL